MSGLVEQIYEHEIEERVEMKRIDVSFEKQLNKTLREALPELSEDSFEEVQGQVLECIFVLKKEVFAFGFQYAIRLMLESIL